MSEIIVHEADSFADMYGKLDHERYWRGHRLFKNLRVAKQLITSHDFVGMQLWKLEKPQNSCKYVVVW